MEASNKIQKKSMALPDETRSFEKGKVEIAKVANTSIGRAYFEPGWSWEKCVKPIVKTDSCQAPHTQYVISGKLRELGWTMGVKKNMVLVMLVTYHLDTMLGL